MKIIALIIGFGLMVNTLYAQSISSSDLINNAKQYDGKVVDYQGEVIGDIMVRGQHAWLNVNDGQNAIGIWMKNSLVKDIKYGGSYGFQGDTIAVSGIFHRACIEHGGDLDIHAEDMRKISSGRQIIENVNFGKIKSILILLAILALVSVYNLSGPKSNGKIKKFLK